MPPNRADGSHLLAVILVLPAGLAGCSSELSSQPPAVHAHAVSASKIVRVSHPEALQRESGHPSNLYVERDVRVTARRSGVLEQVLVDRGDSVRAGQTLAVLESDTASAELEIARQELLLTKLDLDRVQPLFEQKIASMSDYDRAKIALAGAQSRVTLAEAALERCAVRAPFSGQIAERWAVVGLRVEEDDGTPLFRVVARDALRARVDMPEGEMGNLKVGGRATVEIPGSEADSSYPARIVFISPAIDSASGTVPVVVETLPTSGALKLGGAVNVRFESGTGTQQALIRLPRDAVVGGNSPMEGEVEIQLVTGGKVEMRRIQLVEARGEFVLVRGSIQPSDQVIVGAGDQLSEGEPVEAREEKH